MKHASGNQLLSMLGSTVWALQPEYLQQMNAMARMIAQGGDTAEGAQAALKAQEEIQAIRRQQIAASTGGTVVVLPLYGVITQRGSYWYGGTATEDFTVQLRQAVADPNVTAIVLDIDSPGGSVSGVDELAAEIFAARSKKTIIAISNTLNASAAYYLSSQASELWVMPSSLTGSIGVYNAHQDISGMLEQYGVKMTLVSAGKFKVEGNSFEPLTPEALAAAQKLVDGYYAAFVKAVARGRGVKALAVMEGFGEGRVVMAAEAVALGMADKVGTLDAVLAKFGVKRNGNDGNYAEGQTEAPIAAAILELPAAASPDPDADPEGDGDGDTDDDPCQCPCSPCMESDCAGCTADDCDAAGCTCKAAKKDAEETASALALQKQRVAVSLVL